MKSRREAKTRTPRGTGNDARGRNLVEILDRARVAASTRVRVLRNEEEADAIALPADGLDVARSLAEVETHASLIDQVEGRLAQIDDALNRLEQGLYGLCEECGIDIPAVRLKVLPFATRCVDCQETRDQTHRGGGDLLGPYVRRWKVPPEMAEGRDIISRDAVDRAPEEKLAAYSGRLPGREEEAESEQPMFLPPRAQRGSSVQH